MFYLKKIDNQDNLNQLKDLIQQKTNPMPSMKLRFREGYYSKIDDKTISVIIDSGEGLSSKGNPTIRGRFSVFPVPCSCSVKLTK